MTLPEALRTTRRNRSSAPTANMWIGKNEQKKHRVPNLKIIVLANRSTDKHDAPSKNATDDPRCTHKTRSPEPWTKSLFALTTITGSSRVLLHTHTFQPSDVCTRSCTAELRCVSTWWAWRKLYNKKKRRCAKNRLQKAQEKQKAHTRHNKLGIHLRHMCWHAQTHPLTHEHRQNRAACAR